MLLNDDTTYILLEKSHYSHISCDIYTWLKDC